MKILICMSVVPDTTTKVKFINNKLDTANLQWVINPWDELALTRALELKEDTNNAVDKVTVIHVGSPANEAVIRKALAIGADNAVRINAEPIDAYFTAHQIAEFLKTEPYEIILAGIESSDYNGFSIGNMVAELLDAASISSVSGIQIEGENIQVEREKDGGKEFLSTEKPLVASVQKGIAIYPRIPSMRGIMMARKKPLRVVEPATGNSLSEIISFELPTPKAACKQINPENVSELIELLHKEAKVI